MRLGRHVDYVCMHGHGAGSSRQIAPALSRKGLVAGKNDPTGLDGRVEGDGGMDRPDAG